MTAPAWDVTSVPDGKTRALLTKLASAKPGDIEGLSATLARLSAFQDLLSSSDLPTLAPLLPLLLNLNGQPYSLKDHFPFEALYQTRLAREVVYKSARQVAKSTNMSARSLLLCNAIPDFTYLCMTPQYEQIRRFSTQYVRPFIETSPVRHAWTGTHTENSVLMRSFTNRSKMIFSFAMLSCDRVRGVAASSVMIDESVCGQTTWVTTDTGPKKISDVKPGDSILSYDRNRNLAWDVVTHRSYHGRRRCWRLRCADGSFLTATSETWITTSEGWKRVGEIIDEFDLRTRADAPGDSSGGRGDRVRNESPSLRQQARVEAARVQLSEIHNLVTVRRHASQEAEERRLRGVAERFQDVEQSGIRLLKAPVLPTEPGKAGLLDESGHASVARPGRLAGDSLVDGGRREPKQQHDCVPHRELPEGGGGSDFGVAYLERYTVKNAKSVEEEDREGLLDSEAVNTGKLPVSRKDTPVLPGLPSVQTCPASETGRSDVCGMRESIYVEVEEPDGTGFHEDVLRRRSVSDSAEQSQVRTGEGRSGLPRSTQQESTRTLLSRCRKDQSKEKSGDCALRGEASRRGEQSEASSSGCCEGSQGTEDAGVRDLRDGHYSDRSATEILFDVPLGSHDCYQTTSPGKAERDQACDVDRAVVPKLWGHLPGSPVSGNGPEVLLYDMQDSVSEQSPHVEVPLEEVDLVGIDYMGWVDVYDVTTALHHTFIANGIATQNCQDMDVGFLPIIKETMGGPSSWRLFTTTGTPKTLDNTIHGLWSSSSQAEWCIPCSKCKKINIPAMGYDIEKMIGPDHPGIGLERPGTICAKCGTPIDPRTGRWVHRYPKLRWKFPGYHVPQIIMPMHYADRERWGELLAKQRGYGNTTVAQFYNEVLGESYDIGTKLVNETDLRKASCLPWRNNPLAPLDALAHLRSYDLLVLAVDWGGGGEKEVSFTTCAVLGWRPDGKIDVVYGRKLLTPNDSIREAGEVLEIFRQFNCHLLCHDYTGAGALRETLIVQAGVPIERIVAISYVAAARQNIMVYREPSEFHPRHYYQVDKTRSLVLTCSCIKLGMLRFFQYDYESNDNPGLTHDFLALVENKIPTRAGSDLYTITRSSLQSDDFAQAVNIGCCTVWYRTSSWPNLAALANLQITVEQMKHIAPDNPWGDDDFVSPGGGA